MAVAEERIVERAPRNPLRDRALKSSVGGLYVLAGLWVIFAGLPQLWSIVFAGVNEFIAGALLVFVIVAVVVGFLLLGKSLDRKAAAPPGFRAGVFWFDLMALLGLWIGQGVADALASPDSGPLGPAVGMAVAVLVLVVAAVWLMLLPGFVQQLISIEEQGWFHGIAYKPTQGVRVRRCTLLALLVLGGVGIWRIMWSGLMAVPVEGVGHDVALTFGTTVIAGDTYVHYLPLMFASHIWVPLILAGLLVWFSWRLVNWPMFADFLIATEAEMNKVSWTSRQRLMQDTIVVLVTVVLLTVFLFFVDILWIRILSSPPIQVLQVNLKQEQLKQQEKTQW